MKSLLPSPLVRTVCASGVSNARPVGLALPASCASADDVLFLRRVSARASASADDAGGATASSDAAPVLVLRSMIERTEATDVAPDEDEARRPFEVPTSVILDWLKANGAALVEHRASEGVHHAGAAELSRRGGACAAGEYYMMSRRPAMRHVRLRRRGDGSSLGEKGSVREMSGPVRGWHRGKAAGKMKKRKQAGTASRMMGGYWGREGKEMYPSGSSKCQDAGRTRSQRTSIRDEEERGDKAARTARGGLKMPCFETLRPLWCDCPSSASSVRPLFFEPSGGCSAQ